MDITLKRILISIAGFLVGFFGSALVRKIQEAKQERDRINRHIDQLDQKLEKIEIECKLCMDHFEHLARQVTHLAETIGEIKKKAEENDHA